MTAHPGIMQYALRDGKRLLRHSRGYALCMMTPNQRLREARKKAGFASAVEAADALGIKRSTYIGHENGHRGFPATRAPAYARKFKVSPEWLLYGTGGEATEVDGAVPVHQIPVLGDVPAGNWREAVKSSRQTMMAPEPEIPPAAYALRVRGDSMDHIVDDGAWIVIDPTDLDLYEPRLYVIRNGEGETTFKRYREAPARLVPVSSNPSHKEIAISSGDFIVLGRVIWYGGRL